jgi:hypothetical protein
VPIYEPPSVIFIRSKRKFLVVFHRRKEAGELDFLRSPSKQNGYSDRHITWPLNPPESRTAPRQNPFGLSALQQHDIQPHDQAAVQTQYQVCGPTPKDEPQLPSACERRRGTQVSRCTQRPVRVRLSLHRADRPFHWGQDQGAPMPRPSGAAREISRGRTQHQSGPPH